MQRRVLKSLEKADSNVEEMERLSSDPAKVEGMAAMDLKEIVVESTRLIKLKARELTPFLLLLYGLLRAIMFCWKIVELHEYGRTHVLKVVDPEAELGYGLGLSVLAGVCFYPLTVCTTLILASPFQMHGNEEPEPAVTTFDPAYVFNKAWKLFLTTVMKSLLICIVASICAAVTVLVLPMPGNVVTALIRVEILFFLLWLANFLVYMSLTTAVVVLERDWAVDGMMRSAKLVGSKRKTAAGVMILDVVVVAGIHALVIASTTGPTWMKPVGFIFAVAMAMASWLWCIAMRTVLYLSCVAMEFERNLEIPRYVKTPKAEEYQILPSN